MYYIKFFQSIQKYDWLDSILRMNSSPFGKPHFFVSPKPPQAIFTPGDSHGTSDMWSWTPMKISQAKRATLQAFHTNTTHACPSSWETRSTYCLYWFFSESWEILVEITSRDLHWMILDIFLDLWNVQNLVLEIINEKNIELDMKNEIYVSPISSHLKFCCTTAVWCSAFE